MSFPKDSQKLLWLVMLGIGGLLGCLALLTTAIQAIERATPTASQLQVVVQVSRPEPAPTAIAPVTIPPVTAAPAVPTPTSTRVVTTRHDPTATARAVSQATRQAETKAQVLAQIQEKPGPAGQFLASESGPSQWRSRRLVLAHYFAWYDGHGWDACNISAQDKPLKPYHSDDPAAIANHLQLAQAIGLNGFTLHWFKPGNRTDRNFETLLHLSEGSDFASTVVFSRHIFPAPPPSQRNIAEALSHISQRYGAHPNFLRLDHKPVIFFTDVYRTPGGQSPLQFWAEVRDLVDRQRQSWWIAEGLDVSYLTVFDGLYVFKVSHATSLHDYTKSPIWGDRVRAQIQQTGRPKLWIATISPGWDDLRSGCRADLRVQNRPHRLSRADGAVYEASFTAALASRPDWLIVNSFNEWVEGTYIEPSQQYGEKYLQLTTEFVARFQSDREAGR